jgi:hypothetical protein
MHHFVIKRGRRIACISIDMMAPLPSHPISRPGVQKRGLSIFDGANGMTVTIAPSVH